MLQYMLCSPIWINVLNIYAFSNLHDFSWGTKEDRLEEDLGSAAANKDGTVEVELPTDQADIGELLSEKPDVGMSREGRQMLME